MNPSLSNTDQVGGRSPALALDGTAVVSGGATRNDGRQNGLGTIIQWTLRRPLLGPLYRLYEIRPYRQVRSQAAQRVHLGFGAIDTFLVPRHACQIGVRSPKGPHRDNVNCPSILPKAACIACYPVIRQKPRQRFGCALSRWTESGSGNNRQADWSEISAGQL